MTALGGTAEFDGKKTWTVKYNDTETTVTTNGKFKIDGKRVKGDDFTVWLDEEKDRFYISAPALAQIIGRNYTDLGDGAFAFTTLSLDGLDSQKTYLDSLRSGLSDAVDGDIPEADVYIALTFDDGPTGKSDSYPNGLTNYLLDGLKERGAKATFLMVGNRVSEVSDVLPRMVSEGHELGNHTMTHPMCHPDRSGRGRYPQPDQRRDRGDQGDRGPAVAGAASGRRRRQRHRQGGREGARLPDHQLERGH